MIFPFASPEARSDLAQCHALLRHGSKSFHAASLLLPRAVRAQATALYAFCRVADDAVDHSDQPLEAVAELERRLDAIFDGRPYNNPIDRSLTRLVTSTALPRAPLDLLLEGFAWDATGKHYASLADVRAYAVRVAGTVGVMMAHLMGATAASPLARACDLGVAMQLLNIARDVGEDARAGRLYLPREWFAEQGLSPDAFLAEPRSTAPIRAMTRRLITEAERLAVSSIEGIAVLPLECRPAIHAARLIYGEIGHEIARQDFNSIDRRAVVSSGRKLALLAEALAASGLRPTRMPIATLPEAVSLISASVARRGRTLEAPEDALKVYRILAIFDKLKRADQHAMPFPIDLSERRPA